MVKVGITGGIGSGKSLICRIFSIMGIPIYQADLRARELMNESPLIRQSLISRFGESLYHTGELDRPMLADIIFKDQNEIAFVNSLVHPAVGKDFQEWCLGKAVEKYVIEEAALLFESGGYRQMDVMVTVTGPEELRIQRVMAREGTTAEKVLERIRNQWPDDKKIEKSNFVILNDEQHSVLGQVHEIHKILISK